MNSDNLLLLANFLETEIPDQNFDMAIVSEDGMIGHAIHWATYCPGLEMTEREKWCGFYKRPYYHVYSERICGFHCLTEAWDYMFNCNWKEHDNSRLGCVKRIREVANGLYGTSPS